MESLVCMTNAFTALRRILILTGSTVQTHRELNSSAKQHVRKEWMQTGIEAFVHK